MARTTGARTTSVAPLLIVPWLLLTSLAFGGNTPTTTTLAVSANSVVAETAVTFTATVMVEGSPVAAGQVIFCDAAAAHCDGAAVFGVAQITSAGAAAIRRTLGVGTYSIAAVFSGLSGISGSVSLPQAVTVTGAGNYGSVSVIAASGDVGDYTLTATVTAFGRQPATGTVSFLDATYGDAQIASAALSLPTLATAFREASGSPLSDNFARFVVSADFNGDGIPDLAVANLSAGGGVSVFIGNGDGSFRPPVNYGAGVNPQMIAVADVNGDGALDLIVANQCADQACANGSVSILLGLGDGRFLPQVSFASGGFSTFVAVGDFNGDGWPDLAVVNSQDNTVGILLGTGDARLFQPQITCAVGGSPQGVAVGDFNQDTFQDLAVSNSADGTVSILLGNGDGTFQAQQIVPLPASVSPAWLVAADLRNIGILDLVVPDAGASNQVYVLLGDGDGSFPAAVGYPVDSSQDAVSIGDLNGDEILDLVVADNIENGHVSVLFGNGDGTFALKKDYPVGSNPSSVALADFNGDGMLDLATADNGSSTATVLLQAQTETATATGVAVFPAGIHNVLASYPGDSDRAPSRSNTVALMGSSPASTATALTAAPNPASLGQSVTLTGSVIPVPQGTPLGTINFYNGSSLLGTVSLNSSGMATFSTTTLPVGVDSLTAAYSGNNGFASSTSNPVQETITAPTSPIITTTTLAASPDPAAVLQTVSLTATVAPVPSGSLPGTVSFYNGTVLLGSVSVGSDGTADFSTTTLPVGVDSLTAAYSGNSGFASSISNPVQEIITAPTDPTSTTTTLAASPNPAVLLQTVSLTATVAPAPGSSLPGTVSFYNGTVLLGSVSVGSDGTATLATTTLPVGVDSLTAAYSGSSGFASSISNPVQETITAPTDPPNPSFSVTALPASVAIAAGGSAEINVSVLSVNGTFNSVVTMSATGVPAGTMVSFDPPTVIPGSSGALTVMSIQPAAAARLTERPGKFLFASFAMAIALCGMRCKPKYFSLRIKRALALTALAFSTFTLISCAGGGFLVSPSSAGSSSGPAGPGGPTGTTTPPTTYIVTITGSAGSLQASAFVTVTAQ